MIAMNLIAQASIAALATLERARIGEQLTIDMDD